MQNLRQFKILGTKYRIKYVNSNKDMVNEENTGECDYSEKVIRVAKHDIDMNENSQEWIKDTLIHEIGHAFLYETGNQDINDERTVEVLSKFYRFVNSLLKNIE